ncbi:MAG: hypothetical protein ACREIU_11205, partial [Planctomycetota bacterium]
MRTSRLLLATAALAGAWLLSIPTTSTGYTLAGFSLNTNVRDFRVRNTWPPDANTNFTQDPVNFPGAVGPVLACWKAATEWASWPHNGAGLGDPTQPPFPDSLGSGEANFDFVWAGTATTEGGLGDRIISYSPTPLIPPGVPAIIEGPGGGPNATGWRIRFSPEFLWHDGVGNMTPFDPRFDIQGLATIELGLALGLGLVNPPTLPTNPIQTMFGAVQSGPPSVDRRSIQSDDRTGLQVIYGLRAVTKPRILGVQPVGAIAAQFPMVIQGQNFGATGNEVWFNPGGAQASGTGLGAAIVKVPDLASSSGGTQIIVVPPCNVVDGDIFVKVNLTTPPSTEGNTLSNAFAVHFTSGGNGAACAQCIGSIVPASVPVLSVPMTEMTVVAPPGDATMGCVPGAPNCVSPSQYSTLTSIDVGGVTLGTGEFVVDNDNQVRFGLPLFTTLGTKSIAISTAGGPSCPSTFTVNAVTAHELDTGPPIQLVGQTFTCRMATPLGFFHVIAWSSSNLPSEIPGVISLGIANNFTDLHSFPGPAPNAAGVSQFSAIIPPA